MLCALELHRAAPTFSSSGVAGSVFLSNVPTASRFPRGHLRVLVSEPHCCVYWHRQRDSTPAPPPPHWLWLIVYLLQCDCGCYYIGKTIQKLWQIIYHHIWAMKTTNPDLPLGRHVAQVHNGRFPRVTILVLDRIHPSSQGGDFKNSSSSVS